MRIFITSFIALTFCVGAFADNVSISAGGLERAITDNSITSLTVSGTMDARDFIFLRDSLNELKTVDLSAVNIVAFNSSEVLADLQTNFAAGELPATSFFGKKITTITLPTGLTTIGKAAFAGCEELTSITFPSTVTTIGDYAFSGSGLTEITLEENITTIGKGAFSRCEDMQMASILTAAPLSDFMFLGCTALSEVTVDGEVSAVGIGTFNGCNALTYHSLPSTVTTIGDEAYIASGVSALGLSKFNALDSIGSWAFAQTPVTSAALPSSLAKVGDGIFAHDYKLTDVTLSSGMKEIGNYQFASDTLLNIATIVPEGYTTIGDYAFYNNSQEVDTVVLPSTTEWLGTRAMAGMTGMKNLATLATTVPELGDSVWAGVNQPIVNLDTRETEGNEIADLYIAAAQWQDFHVLRNYVLGDVNCDGLINVNDVTTLIDYILGNNPSPINLDVADLDNNGIYNTDDVSLLIDYLLGEGTLGTIRKVKGKQRSSSYDLTTDALRIDATNLAAGDTKTLSVLLSDIEHNYRALQCYITLPEGLTVTGITVGNRATNHSVAYHQNDDGTIFLLCYAAGNQPFNAGEDALLNITVVADNDFDATTASIGFTGTLLSVGNYEAYWGEDTDNPLLDATGVESVTTAQAKIYAYEQQLIIEAPEAGEAYVVAMNGTMRTLNVAAGKNVFTDLPAGIYVVRLGIQAVKVRL